MISNYTKKQLNEMASGALREYRKAHRDRIRKYKFAEIPWHITVGEGGAQLNVQIQNSETGWTENYNYAL
jgi:hypothetical protein